MQVIPAGQTAVFPVALLSGSSRTFHHNVDVVVNGVHFLHLTVQADVIDPAVRLSHTDIDFALSTQDWLDHCDKLILMENTQAVPCPYEWCNPMTGVFNVAPMHGCIPPHSSSEALIRWAPPPEASHQGFLSKFMSDIQDVLCAEEFLDPIPCCHAGGSQQQCTLMLKVNGSTTNSVRLKGHVPEMKLQCIPKAVDLHTICLGLPVKVNAELANYGGASTAFRAHTMSSEMTCHPSSTVIEASASVAIEVCFTPSEVGILRTSVDFEQRGGSSVSLAIMADVRIPRAIRFIEDVLDFGTLYQGASNKLPLTLTNRECLSCELEIDLSTEHLLTLSLAPGQWDPSSGADTPLEEFTASDEHSVYVLMMEA